MNSKHHELGNLHEIGDPNLHGISQPKGGASGFGKLLKHPTSKDNEGYMDQKLWGIVPIETGKRPKCEIPEL